jgi:hypothetical protein
LPPELLTMGKAVIANACVSAAQRLGRLRRATVDDSDPQILTMHSAVGPKASRAGMHLSALG